jgi:Protein of unknown function (DUF3060)
MRTIAVTTATGRTLSSIEWLTDAKGAAVIRKAVGRSLAALLIAFPITLAVGVPAAQAKNGDTHITGQGIVQALDCNESTLHVMGTGNQVTALGTCWAVTVMGSSNTVVADTVINDITVYGWDQTVLFHNGDPFLWDRGRELGMTNRLDRVPA